MAVSDYDAKKYKCAPWHGQRGPTWERIFKNDFENALRNEKDTFSNLNQYLFGMDFGGWAAGAPPHIIGQGALAAQNALSIPSPDLTLPVSGHKRINQVGGCFQQNTRPVSMASRKRTKTSRPSALVKMSAGFRLPGI